MFEPVKVPAVRLRSEGVCVGHRDHQRILQSSNSWSIFGRAFNLSLVTVRFRTGTSVADHLTITTFGKYY
jgi:hypothetical protein